MRRTIFTNSMNKMILYSIFIVIAFSGIGLVVAQSDAINFTAFDINGNKIILSNYYDKLILLDFWATWCPPCKKEIPNLIDIKNTFKNQKFEIISVNGYERGEDSIAAKFVRDNNMNWIHIIDKKLGAEIAGKYNVQYIPAIFIIKNGKIVEANLRGEELKRRIGELLK